MASNKKYKREYLDSIEKVVPAFYFAEDYDLSGTQRKLTDTLVNSHINFCINEPNILAISATTNYSDIGTVPGLSRWFVIENNLTEVTSRTFELDILHPLGYCAGEYTGKKCTFFTKDNSVAIESADQRATFRSFLEDTVLPKIVLNTGNMADNTASAFSNTSEGTHEYLVDKLGWAYFLNTKGSTADAFSPSSYVASAISDVYFDAITFDTNTGIKGLTEYLWRDWENLSATYPSILPGMYAPAGGVYTSGIQNLSAIKTLIDIVYSEQHLNKDDPYIKDAFLNYITTGDFLEGEELAAPFARFLQSLSYSFFDTNNAVSKLSNIYDIEKCPEEFLPYIADLIGWTLYGSSPDSWRRQIRGATKLYKQKGTKVGLHNAITTVLPTVGIQLSAISEFYESYVPNLLYYLIKTDTTLFDSFDSFSAEKAKNYIDNYDPQNMDNNIRMVVDNILLKAVLFFPELFYIRTFKFDINDPKFQFFYRNRAFPIPPWEEEKFYSTCDITDELLAFLERELVCLGVRPINSQAFRSFVGDHTVNGSVDTKFYNNGFFFLTSSVYQPPNRDYLFDNFEVDKYDFIPLWSGKSSHFDVDVSSGSFDAAFFQGLGFSKQDFFQSLAIVDSFSPSKAIPQTRVNLDNTDNLSSLDYICPSMRYWVDDVTLSGVQAGSHTSGMDFRSIVGTMGSSYTSPPNSIRSFVNHNDKTVFDRSFIDGPFDHANLMGSSITVPPLTNLYRNAMRRRNFEKNLQKGGLYTRTGFNMPSYFNTSSQDLKAEYQPLGLLNLIFKYHKVLNPFNLYEVSSCPYNLDVWSECWGLDSTRVMSGIPASSTFDIRGSASVEVSTCNSYVARERTPEFYKYLHKIRDKKFEYQAKYLAEKNKFLLDLSSFQNSVVSIKNDLWNKYEYTEEETNNTILGQRRLSRGSLAGIHKSFKDYITYYNGHSVGNGLLDTQKDGGLNILSHAYGPLVYNGNFTVEGSGVDTSSQFIGRAISEEKPFSVKDLSGISNITASSTDDLYVGGPEYRNPYLLSGVEFTDLSAGYSKFTIFNLDPSTTVKGEPSALARNPIVLCKPSGALSRLRYDVRSYGPSTNLLIPEHDFEIDLRAFIATEDSHTLGGGSYGVWIHTDTETDYYGNKVFWTYMPNGKWELTYPSVISGTTGPQYVKNTLSHTLKYDEVYEVAENVDICILSKSTKDVLMDITPSSFLHKVVNFNTNNAPIRVPLSYYQYKEQVHRTNQNYIIEVFMYDTFDKAKFGVIDQFSIRDITQNSRLHHKHSFPYSDYEEINKPEQQSSKFLYKDGGAVPSGVYIWVDYSGEITASGGDKVTLKESTGPGISNTKATLYSKVKATEYSKWVKDANGKALKVADRIYAGPILLGASSTMLEPSTITIVGTTKGSNITKDVSLYIPYSEDETLAILREFNRLQQDLAARNSSIAEKDIYIGQRLPGGGEAADRYGLSGGSRLSYRAAPMWSQPGGHVTFVTNNNQYTKIHLEN